jgi:hypothetical protein
MTYKVLLLTVGSDCEMQWMTTSTVGCSLKESPRARRDPTVLNTVNNALDGDEEKDGRGGDQVVERQLNWGSSSTIVSRELKNSVRVGRKASLACPDMRCSLIDRRSAICPSSSAHATYDLK